MTADGLLANADEAMRARDFARAARFLEQYLASKVRPAPDDYMRLAAARRALGDAVGALDSVGGALRIAPQHFMALLMGGSLLAAMGRVEEAARTYAAAIEHAPSADRLPPVLVRELDRARLHVEQQRSWRDGLVGRALDGLGDADPAERDRIERFRSTMIETGASGGGLVFPDLPMVGFYDPARFPGIAALEDAFDIILAEFRALVEARAPELVSMIEHAPGSVTDASDEATRKWSVINLLRNGENVAENAEFCPETIRLYRDLDPPFIAGRSPNLMFSLLDAHTRIPAHTGVTNTRLTLHLPLIVPSDCAIRVGTRTHVWRPGEAMVFDDTIEHEAWNDSDQLRVVLLGDLWRAEMSPVERGAVTTLMAR